MKMYDPPEGWKYGFPKQFNPLPGESIEDTLRRDGYPEELIALGWGKYTRMWGISEEEFEALNP